MSLLAIGAMAVGTGLQVSAQLKEGKEAAKAGKTAQQQLREEAKATEAAGAYESREKRKEGIRAKASAIAQAVAQGGVLTGSKLENIASEASEYEADARVLMHNYQTQAVRLRNRGKLERYQGRQMRRASRIRAAATIAKNVGVTYMMGGFNSPGGGDAPRGFNRGYGKGQRWR